MLVSMGSSRDSFHLKQQLHMPAPFLFLPLHSWVSTRFICHEVPIVLLREQQQTSGNWEYYQQNSKNYILILYILIFFPIGSIILGLKIFGAICIEKTYYIWWWISIYQRIKAMIGSFRLYLRSVFDEIFWKHL